MALISATIATIGVAALESKNHILSHLQRDDWGEKESATNGNRPSCSSSSSSLFSHPSPSIIAPLMKIHVLISVILKGIVFTDAQIIFSRTQDMTEDNHRQSEKLKHYSLGSRSPRLQGSATDAREKESPLAILRLEGRGPASYPGLKAFGPDRAILTMRTGWKRALGQRVGPGVRRPSQLAEDWAARMGTAPGRGSWAAGSAGPRRALGLGRIARIKTYACH
ncbi:hypothetical protein CRG98_031925 [Punica granatum]|uniref:Uncharacterized protein n=1 Tax=Punica granatum TaxID=22663 RepID=A0A2I0IUG6_PUNGR|nr:hypothetical protein CRG98_031925 [Punica granatum]